MARFGQGWHPLSVSPSELQRGLQTLRSLTDKPLNVAVRLMINVTEQRWDRPVAARKTARGTVPELRELFLAYAEAGATDIILDANTPDLGAIRAMLQTLRGAGVPG